MPNSLLLEAEAKLKADQDGSYRTQLMEFLNERREQFATARQGFLPPEEYDVAESMETALAAALAIIRDHQPPADALDMSDEVPAAAGTGPMINV
jgi:hypothetical protein